MLGDLLLKTVEKYVDVFVDALASKYDLPKNELKSLWKETVGAGKKKSYKKMKLDELQKLCEERNILLKKSRKKQQYIDALEEDDKKEGTPVAPSVEEPSPVEPSVEEPSPVAPSVEEPSPVAPSVEEPSPAFCRRTSPVAPSVEEPSPVEPSVEEPSPVAPSVEEPSPVEPSVEEPSPVAPSVEEPSPVEPSVEEPSPVAPSVEEPSPASKPKKAKKKKSPLKEKGESIESYAEKITSMEKEDEKDVLDMNFTELKKFCKGKGMDTRQKTKQQLLDWIEDKEKTTDFSEFLTDVSDLI